MHLELNESTNQDVDFKQNQCRFDCQWLRSTITVQPTNNTWQETKSMKSNEKWQRQWHAFNVLPPLWVWPTTTTKWTPETWSQFFRVDLTSNYTQQTKNRLPLILEAIQLTTVQLETLYHICQMLHRSKTAQTSYRCNQWCCHFRNEH